MQGLVVLRVYEKEAHPQQPLWNNHEISQIEKLKGISFQVSNRCHGKALLTRESRQELFV